MSKELEMLQKLADDAEHLVNILERKACEEWNYDYQRATIERARELIRPAPAPTAGEEK